jgi:hypothetical protein
VFHQALGRREAEAIVAYLMGEALQVGLLPVVQDDKVVPRALRVAQEQVLTVRRIDTRLVLLRLLDGEDGRVLVQRIGYAQRIEDGQCFSHGCDYTNVGPTQEMFARLKSTLASAE